MPVIKVRLGPQVRVDANNQFLDGVQDLLYKDRWLRNLIVRIGMAEAIEHVEMEVTHDANGWDRNVEPIKIEIHADLSGASREQIHRWLDEILREVGAKCAETPIRTDVTNYFQIAIFPSGHSIGAIWDTLDANYGEIVHKWGDELKRPDLPTGDPLEEDCVCGEPATRADEDGMPACASSPSCAE